MKTREAVTAEKLRGGFYSPDPLVQVCLDRLTSLVGDATALEALEPSAGDGAFLRCLAVSELSARIDWITAVEILPSEATACQASLDSTGVDGEVLATSVVNWFVEDEREFDLAFGNPPFVRYQFVDDLTKQATERLAKRLGVALRGVSNLWVPVLLGTLNKLRKGGAFAFVVPAECFTGISAGVIRHWLLTHTRDISLDLFPPNSFPGVLQEVVVLSGRRVSEDWKPSTVMITEHHESARPIRRKHRIDASPNSWTRLLLSPSHLAALDEANALLAVHSLGSIAKFEVATVTGANEFFSIDSESLASWELESWQLPLLPRIRNAEGLIYGDSDHDQTIESGARAFMLDFAPGRDNPERHKGAAAYLVMGEEQGLNERFKCRIRSPWYRVPVVPPGQLMMSKRSHRFPRVVVNEAGVVTTDTIYRGRVVQDLVGPNDIAAVFHNSLTLLTAELEGRSFGGGVLELVPSEVSRLRCPLIPELGKEIGRLDAIVRSMGSDDDFLIDETDRLIEKADVGLNLDLLGRVREGRDLLLQRRMDRNSAS